MKFGVLVLHNFFRTLHVEIDLSKPGLTFMRGENRDVGKSNEAGKSTIFMGLSWVCYGRFPGGPARPGDEIVNPKAKHDCWGELQILDDNYKEIAKIKRTRMEGPKHKDAKLYVDFQGTKKEFDLRQQDTSSSTAYVASILGMDYEMFLKQRYFAQEDIVPVTRLKNTALKQFCLENLLKIDWTHRALERARNEVGRLKALITSVLTVRETTLKGLVSRHDRLREYRSKDAEWQEREFSRRREIVIELKENTDLLKQAEKENIKIDKAIVAIEKRYKKEETTIKNNLDVLAIPADLDGEIEAQERKLRTVVTEKGKIEGTVTLTKDKIERLKAREKDAQSQIGEQCESCGTIITKKHLPFMVKELKADVRAKTLFVKDQEKVLGELEGRSELITDSLKLLRERREGQKAIRETRQKILIEQAQLAGKKQKELAKAEEDRIDVDVIKREIDRLTKAQSKTETNPYTSLIAKEIEEWKSIAAETRKLKKKRKEHEADLEIASHWDKAFSGKIQAWLLDDVTGVINKFIAGYMMDLADGRISVKLHTVQRLKSGDYRENFGIQVNNMDGSDTFMSLSGGAKRRVDLAVSLALSDFQRAISEKQLDFLCLDEVTSFLDSAWEKKFYDLVKKKYRNMACFVISHKDIDVTDFDRTITIIKENGITRLET